MMDQSVLGLIKPPKNKVSYNNISVFLSFSFISQHFKKTVITITVRTMLSKVLAWQNRMKIRKKINKDTATSVKECKTQS